MEFTVSPDHLTKLTRMGDVTLYEPAGDQPTQEKRRYQSHSLSECISNVTLSGGVKKPVLKTLLTTACQRNCFYCPFRAGRSKTERHTFTPDEMAKSFNILQQAKQVDGLFLTSGIIKGSVNTQDRLIATAEIIRKRYSYRGYIHLKVMPGLEEAQLYRAMQLASRVSVNLEGATAERLSALAPQKDYDRELLNVLLMAERIRQQHPHEKLASTVTQFVVGAVGDTDLELLSVSEKLYQQGGLARAYYSAFHPVLQTPFEDRPPVDAIRENRLYQASFLLRDYGWSSEELSFQADGNLRTDVDPKRAWADAYLLQAPIELMTASREALMRVPGIGPVTVQAILRARQTTTLTDLTQLHKLGLRSPQQAAPYILLNGRRPDQQMTLW